MSAYAIKTKDGDFVGIFAVDAKRELFWLIDECCDPGECLYRKIPSGGIYWPAPVEKKDSDETDYMDEAWITDWWGAAIMEGFDEPDAGGKWKPVSDIITAVDAIAALVGAPTEAER